MPSDTQAEDTQASAVLSALCRQFCASLASALKQSRSVNGKVVRLHSITDPLQQFATTKVLSHWEAWPELVLGD